MAYAPHGAMGLSAKIKAIIEESKIMCEISTCARRHLSSNYGHKCDLILFASLCFGLESHKKLYIKLSVTV